MFIDLLVCVMSLREDSKISIAAKSLQWIAAMLTVLCPAFRGKINSTIIGVVHLSLTHFIPMAYLIMRSRISVLYGLGLVRESMSELIESSSGRASDRCMV